MTDFAKPKKGLSSISAGIAGSLLTFAMLMVAGWGGQTVVVEAVHKAVTARLDAEGLQRRLMGPIRDGEVQSNTDNATVGMTELELITTDITAAQTAAGEIQIITVSNYHASQYLCVDEVDFSDQDSTDCGTDCDAAGLTCDGTVATDGKHRVMPSSQRSLIFDSDRCVCVVGSAAGTSFSAERVLR